MFSYLHRIRSIHIHAESLELIQTEFNKLHHRGQVRQRLDCLFSSGIFGFHELEFVFSFQTRSLSYSSICRDIDRTMSHHVSLCLSPTSVLSTPLSRNRTIIISVNTDNHYTGISCNSGRVLDTERYQIIQLAPTMDLEHFSAIPDNYLGC